MENLAKRVFDPEVDKKVKEELVEAGIPVISLGIMDNEVKTHYIGILNGFIFERAWYYWIVRGNMPLEHAKYLYDNFKELEIRTNGMAGNDEPEKWAKNKDFHKLMEPYIEKLSKKEITMDELKDICDDISKQGEQVITSYHIDTQAGLNKLAETIRERNIHTEILESY